jgi:hypothetical protein
MYFDEKKVCAIFGLVSRLSSDFHLVAHSYCVTVNRDKLKNNSFLFKNKPKNESLARFFGLFIGLMQKQAVYF